MCEGYPKTPSNMLVSNDNGHVETHVQPNVKTIKPPLDREPDRVPFPTRESSKYVGEMVHFIDSILKLRSCPPPKINFIFWASRLFVVQDENWDNEGTRQESLGVQRVFIFPLLSKTTCYVLGNDLKQKKLSVSFPLPHVFPCNMVDGDGKLRAAIGRANCERRKCRRHEQKLKEVWPKKVLLDFRRKMK